MSEVQAAIEAALSAGRLLRNHQQEMALQNHNVKSSFRDIQSGADLLAERQIIEQLQAFDPSLPIVSEEAGWVGNKGDVYWVVDPLDGTVNYVHGLPIYAVSIALIVAAEVRIGVIHIPSSGETFSATLGGGAWLSGARINAANAHIFSDGLFAGAWSVVSAADADLAFRVAKDIDGLSRGFLRTGSAAYNLACVAAGRLTGAWGFRNRVWDIAAGLLIVRESGGQVTTHPPLTAGADRISWMASAEGVHDELLRMASGS